MCVNSALHGCHGLYGLYVRYLPRCCKTCNMCVCAIIPRTEMRVGVGGRTAIMCRKHLPAHQELLVIFGNTAKVHSYRFSPIFFLERARTCEQYPTIDEDIECIY